MFIPKDKLENYHTRCADDGHDGGEIQFTSIGEVLEKLNWMVKCCEMNHKDPYKVPFIIEYDNQWHMPNNFSFGHGNLGSFGSVSTSDYYKMFYVAPDTEDPVSTEVEWISRGIGYDLSGFVRSKPSGIRLLHMVQEVLGLEKPKSWLDYREREPNWIQFKFQKEEFDLEKLETLAKANGNKLNKIILNQCRVK